MKASLHCASGAETLYCRRRRRIAGLATFLNFRVSPFLGRLNRTNEISSCVNDKMWLAPLPSPLSATFGTSEGVDRAWVVRGRGHCQCTDA